MNELITRGLFMATIVVLIVLKISVSHFKPRLNICWDCLGSGDRMAPPSPRNQRQCNLAFTSTSLQQYQQFRRIGKDLGKFQKFNSLIKDPKFSREQMSDFHVEVDIVEESSSVELKIMISDHAEPTQGGASFNIHFDSEQFVASYSIRDYFNGTYYGCYVVPKYCFTVTVKLLFVSFAAYFDTGPCPFLNSSIYKKSWCPRQTSVLKFDGNPSFCTTYTYDSYKHGTWITNDNLLEYSERYQLGIMSAKNATNIKELFGFPFQCISHLFSYEPFRWFWKDTRRNCIIKQDNIQSRWKKCLRSFSSVHLFGDSHMRGLFAYMAGALGAYIERDKNAKMKKYSNLFWNTMKHLDEVLKVLGNFSDSYDYDRFMAMNDTAETKTSQTYINDIQMTFRGENPDVKKNVKRQDNNSSNSNSSSSNDKNSNTTVVLLGFGTWDLLCRNLSFYEENVPKINEALLKLRHLSQKTARNFRWIFVTIPAAWDDRKCFCKFSRLKRQPNIFSNAVANALAFQELKKWELEYDIFDYYTLTVHRNNEARDRVHYLTESVPYKGFHIDGSVGRAATDVLLTQLCPS